MAKGNPKTMRFEEKVETYIEAFQGNNFSDKFHNLCYYFMKKEDEYEKQLNLLDIEKEEKQKELDDINSLVYKYKTTLENLAGEMRNDRIKRM